LKRVLERTTQQKAEERRKRQEVQSHLRIAELLSSRCRDIIIKEVVIERDSICDVIASKPFKAFGATMCLELETGSPPSSSAQASDPTAPVTSFNDTTACANNNPAPTTTTTNEKTVGLVLTQRSRRGKRMRLTAFLLKGPDSEIANFTPVILPVQFSRSKRVSDMFPLPLTQSQAKDMFEMGSLTVRIGLIDRRRGVSRAFSNDASARGGDDNDDDSYSSSSDDDDDGMGSEDPDLHYYSTSSDEDDCIHTYMDNDDHPDDLTLY